MDEFFVFGNIKYRVELLRTTNENSPYTVIFSEVTSEGVYGAYIDSMTDLYLNSIFPMYFKAIKNSIYSLNIDLKCTTSLTGAILAKQKLNVIFEKVVDRLTPENKLLLELGGD